MQLARSLISASLLLLSHPFSLFAVTSRLLIALVHARSLISLASSFPRPAEAEKSRTTLPPPRLPSFSPVRRGGGNETTTKELAHKLDIGVKGSVDLKRNKNN